MKATLGAGAVYVDGEPIASLRDVQLSFSAVADGVTALGAATAGASAAAQELTRVLNDPDLRVRFRRHERARKRWAAVLAGGWGRAAQEAAWDQVRPSWRADLVEVRYASWSPGKDLTAIQDLSAALNADGRYLARPWYRLLMQSTCRDHDERNLGRQWGRWGGYPI